MYYPCSQIVSSLGKNQMEMKAISALKAQARNQCHFQLEVFAD